MLGGERRTHISKPGSFRPVRVPTHADTDVIAQVTQDHKREECPRDISGEDDSDAERPEAHQGGPSPASTRGEGEQWMRVIVASAMVRKIITLTGAEDALPVRDQSGIAVALELADVLMCPRASAVTLAL
jgi:hypothetical protein